MDSLKRSEFKVADKQYQIVYSNTFVLDKKATLSLDIAIPGFDPYITLDFVFLGSISKDREDSHLKWKGQPDKPHALTIEVCDPPNNNGMAHDMHIATGEKGRKIYFAIQNEVSSGTRVLTVTVYKEDHEG